MIPMKILKWIKFYLWERKNLVYRVALLEAKYDQLAKEVRRIEKDLIKIFNELEMIKHGRIYHKHKDL